MIVLLDTSTPICKLTLVDGDDFYEHTWQADRSLARDLLAYLRDRLAEHQAGFADIEAIGVMHGPGSFTGLRIGLTVMNTIAADRRLPIVGEQGEDWRERALTRLSDGQDDQIVMPEYGAEARVTEPRK